MKYMIEYTKYRFINLLTALFYTGLILFGIYAFMFFKEKEKIAEDRILIINYPVYIENIGETYKLDPRDENAKVNYESMDEDIATVDQDGLITAVNYGIVTIIAKSDGKRQTVKVIIVDDPTKNIDIKKIPLPTR